VVGHKGQREGAEKSNERRKLSCKQIDHRDGKDSEDQGDDPEVSFGFAEGIELMGENEEERRMKIRRILLIKFYLGFEIISGVIEGMDFVYPKRFLIKIIESEDKGYQETQEDNKEFYSFYEDCG
jgi:hypothetical protein